MTRPTPGRPAAAENASEGRGVSYPTHRRLS